MSPLRTAFRTLLWSLPMLATAAALFALRTAGQGWQLTFHDWRYLLSLPAAALAWGLFQLALRLRGDGAQRGTEARVVFSRAGAFRELPRGWRTKLTGLPPALRLTALVLLGFALARPQRVDAPEGLELSGIDIVLVLDLSGSMRAADLQPTRLTAAKEVIDQFISRRRTDRIGFVVFGREAFPAMAPTLDYTALRALVGSMEIGALSEEAHAGTAIGDGLGTALNYLRRSDARSKVVVLLTDGANNAGHVDPNHAAQFAQALHVKVFTILVGTSDEAPIVTGQDLFGRPVMQMARFPVDPALLQNIAQQTQGQFFRAGDRATLEQAFHSILDNLERSRIADAGVRRTELYPWLLGPAVALLLLELALGTLVLRRFP